MPVSPDSLFSACEEARMFTLEQFYVVAVYFWVVEEDLLNIWTKEKLLQLNDGALLSTG